MERQENSSQITRQHIAVLQQAASQPIFGFVGVAVRRSNRAIVADLKAAGLVKDLRRPPLLLRWYAGSERVQVTFKGANLLFREVGMRALVIGGLPFGFLPG